MSNWLQLWCYRGFFCFGLGFSMWKMLLHLFLILLGIVLCCVWHRSEIKKEASGQLKNSTNNTDRKTFIGSNLWENWSLSVMYKFVIWMVTVIKIKILAIVSSWKEVQNNFNRSQLDEWIDKWIQRKISPHKMEPWSFGCDWSQQKNHMR